MPWNMICVFLVSGFVVYCYDSLKTKLAFPCQIRPVLFLMHFHIIFMMCDVPQKIFMTFYHVGFHVGFRNFWRKNRQHSIHITLSKHQLSSVMFLWKSASESCLLCRIWLKIFRNTSSKLWPEILNLSVLCNWEFLW